MKLQPLSLGDILTSEGGVTSSGFDRTPIDENPVPFTLPSAEEIKGKEEKPEDKVEETSIDKKEETTTEDKPVEESVEETEDAEVNIFAELNSLNGYEIEGEFTNDIEGIHSYTSKIIEKAKEEAKKEFLSEDPEVAKFAEFRKMGGDPDEYFQTHYPEIDFARVEITEEDIESQKAVITDFLSSKNLGKKHIEALISAYEDSGELFQESQTALKELTKGQEESKKALMERTRQEHEARVKETTDYWKKVEDMVVSKGQIQGINVPDKDRKEFFKYLAMDADGKGNSAAAIKWASMSLEEKLAIEYRVFKNFSLEKEVSDKVKKEKVNGIIRTITTKDKKMEGTKRIENTGNTKKIVPLDNLLQQL